MTAVGFGYKNGSIVAPTCRQVCSGATDQVSVVHVTFGPAVIAFREILEVFLVMHRPITLSRQSNDAGT